MHMADALLSSAVAGGMYACSLVAAGYALRKVQQERNDKILPVMGVMGAFVFAVQMLNFTIPGTGSSGHLCGGMLLAAVVGPYAAFLTMIGVLLIQCLLFADGGLLALGANIWNMAFYGCFVGGGVIWALAMRSGMTRTKLSSHRFLAVYFPCSWVLFLFRLKRCCRELRNYPCCFSAVYAAYSSGNRLG